MSKSILDSISSHNKIISILLVCVGIVFVIFIYLLKLESYFSPIDPDAIGAFFVSLGVAMIWDNGLIQRIRKLRADTTTVDTTTEDSFKSLIVIGMLLGAFVSYFATVRESLLTLLFVFQQNWNLYEFFSDITSVLTFALFILLFTSLIEVVSPKKIGKSMETVRKSISVALAIVILTLLPNFNNPALYNSYPSYSLQITILVMILGLILLYKMKDWIKRPIDSD